MAPTSNYQDGESIKDALKLVHIRILTATRKFNSVTQVSFACALSLAIEASRSEQSKSSILLNSYQSHQTIISNAILVEISDRPSSNQGEIVNTLLANGADVNYQEGAVFNKIIGLQTPSKSLGHLRYLPTYRPRETTLHTAFDLAREAQCPLGHRYDIFNLILEAGYKGVSIHPALAEIIIISIKEDVTVPRLLLLYQASVNHEEGLPLALATESGNIKLVSMLLARRPNKSTDNRASKATCHANVSDPCRIGLLQCLLATKIVSKESVTFALKNAITHGSKDEILLGLSVRHGPSIDVETLLSHIGRIDVATPRFLLKLQAPSKTKRSHAFKSCFDLDRATRFAFAELSIVTGLGSRVWIAALHSPMKDQETQLLSLRPKHGRDKRLEVDEGQLLAAITMNSDIVQIFLSLNPGSSAIDHKTLASNTMRKTADSAGTTRLLQRGVNQTLRDRAPV